MNKTSTQTQYQKHIPLFFGVVFLICLVFYLAFDLVYANQVMPGAKFAGQSIGGMDASQAEQLVNEALVESANKDMIFVYDDTYYAYTFDEIGIELDHEATQKSVTKFARGINIFTNFAYRVKSLFGGVVVRAVFNKNIDFSNVLAQLEQELNIEPSEARILIQDQAATVEPMVVGYKLNKDLLVHEIKLHLQNLNISPIQLETVSYSPALCTDAAQVVADRINRNLDNDYIFQFRDKNYIISGDNIWQWVYVDNVDNRFVVGLDQNKLESYIAELELVVNQPMQNAKLEIVDEKVLAFSPHQFGAVLRTKELASLINSNLLTDIRELNLPVNYLEPEIKLSDLNDIGINELVAQGESDFSGSPSNRRHNIATGASKFDLALVKPGVTFSFNQTLGEVDASTGYLPELVIKGDETIPEYGGGLCQVSTTAFRAILNGGYPVVTRKNHSYRVSYYEPAGTDATIYPPYPDLKFTNDSAGYILIDTHIDLENNKLYFDFYGTNPDYTVELEGPRIYNVTAYPDPVYIKTSTIPEGEVRQIDIAHRGADTVLYRYIKDENGRLIRKDIFESEYIPWPAKYLIGVPEGPELEADFDNVLPKSSGVEEADTNI